MKKNIALVMISLFAAVSAFADTAPSASDSWTTINQAVSASLDLSLVQTDYASAFGDTGFFNACTDGTNLRSIAPLTVCVDSSWVRTGGGDRSEDKLVCNQYGLKNVVLSLVQTQQVCTAYTHTGGGDRATDDVCSAYETVTVTLPTAPVFSVVSTTRVGGSDRGYDKSTVLFTKAYQIPACN